MVVPSGEANVDFSDTFDQLVKKEKDLKKDNSVVATINTAGSRSMILSSLSFVLKIATDPTDPRSQSRSGRNAAGRLVVGKQQQQPT